MKILYLSDLDGTLIRSNERISEYTVNTVNRFIQSGGCFSYATARSIVTASKVTAGLNTEFPVICYNGAFIIGNKSGEILLSNYFTQQEARDIRHVLAEREVFPIVYAYINGAERFSFIERYVTPAMRHFLDSRIDDPRRREVETAGELYFGDIIYIACMDTVDSLAPINDIFKSDKRINCIYAKDIYSDTQWCELLPAKATKANAALQLKSMLGCDKLVLFGDGINDLSMFSVADESCATANAVPELKEIATAVIGTNDEDSVAKWIEKHLL